MSHQHPSYFGERQNPTAATKNGVSGRKSLECASQIQAIRDRDLETDMLRHYSSLPEDRDVIHCHKQKTIDHAWSSNTKVASTTSPSKQFIWLVVWCTNNIGVTLLNKVVFSGYSGKRFGYPYMLSAVHMLVGWMGTSMVFAFSGRKRKHIPKNLYRSKVLLFSVVFSLNICIGNVSLRECTVSFNQVIRGLVPSVVVLLGYLLYSQIPTTRKRMAIIPVVSGVAMACYGDMACTVVGVFFSILCVIFAALKVVLSGQMLTGELKMLPLDLLDVMAPLALGQFLLLSIYTSEFTHISSKMSEVKDIFWIVLIGAICSFTLNITSFQANRVTSPLTISVAANVKQVMLILADYMIFPHKQMSMLNAVGILMVIVSSVYYSRVSMSENQSAKLSIGSENECPEMLLRSEMVAAKI
eukprot:494082_1